MALSQRFEDETAKQKCNASLAKELRLQNYKLQQELEGERENSKSLQVVSK
jgi:hypothetical protein